MGQDGFDVVTGGAGFIGSHIVRALLSQGRRVRVVDDFSSGKRENLSGLESDFPDLLEVSEEDIRNLDRIKGLFEGASDVYHQAALTSVQQSVEDPLLSAGVNVEGTLKVLWAAKETGVRKVVLATSTAVYGDSEKLPKSEEMAADPISPYGLTKYVGELYCGIFSSLYQLPTVGLRYFNVFGPRQDPSSEYAAVIPRFIQRFLNNEKPIIFGDGEQTRDFVFVEDVVSANLLAARSDVQGVSLNVALGQKYSLNQIVAMLNEILGASLSPIYDLPRQGEVRHSLADISQAAERIGFSPQVSFQEGLRKTVAWYQGVAAVEG